MAEPQPPAGFREFVTARSSALYRTSLLLTRNAHDAQDLLQDALARTWRSWDQIEGQPEAYCRTVLVRHYLAGRRRKWHGERPTEHLPERPVHDRRSGVPADPGDSVPTRVWLTEAIGALPDRQRAVVVLRYFHDYTLAQTAEALDISLGTVKTHHSRALQALRVGTLDDEDHASSALRGGTPS